MNLKYIGKLPEKKKWEQPINVKMKIKFEVLDHLKKYLFSKNAPKTEFHIYQSLNFHNTKLKLKNLFKSKILVVFFF